MNQNSNFPRYGQQGPQQYGLNSFDTPPQKAGIVERVFGPGIAAKFSSPLFATAAFVVAGVAFAAVIIAAYPGADEEPEIPIITSEQIVYKEFPSDPGGMTIDNRDSTVFTAIEGGQGEEPAPLENLLAETEEPVDKLAAFARQVEETTQQGEQAVEEAVEEVSPTLAAVEPAAAEETEPVTIQKIAKKTEETVKEVEPAKVAAAPPAETDRPKIEHKAGENPDTIEFVKSVLDKKDGRIASAPTAGSAADVATRAASVAPAAGTPGTGFDIQPGSFYVQLASVKSLAGAEGEWGKLQKEFTAELGEAPHRVQAADLGERGTFFRIQAGPMSKDSASKICDSIKAQKPGGCLVTQ